MLDQIYDMRDRFYQKHRCYPNTIFLTEDDYYKVILEIGTPDAPSRIFELSTLLDMKVFRAEKTAIGIVEIREMEK